MMEDAMKREGLGKEEPEITWQDGSNKVWVWIKAPGVDFEVLSTSHRARKVVLRIASRKIAIRNLFADIEGVKLRRDEESTVRLGLRKVEPKPWPSLYRA